MTRRTFLCGWTLGTFPAPLAAETQQAGKGPRIGWLSTSAPGPFDTAFRQGLRELGYVEGQNITIEWRWVRGEFDRLPAVVSELLSLKVDIILAGGTPAALATQKMTAAIPTVMVAGIDPGQAGDGARLAPPSGKITRLTPIPPP